MARLLIHALFLQMGDLTCLTRLRPWIRALSVPPQNTISLSQQRLLTRETKSVISLSIARDTDFSRKTSRDEDKIDDRQS